MSEEEAELEARSTPTLTLTITLTPNPTRYSLLTSHYSLLTTHNSPPLGAQRVHELPLCPEEQTRRRQTDDRGGRAGSKGRPTLRRACSLGPGSMARAQRPLAPSGPCGLAHRFGRPTRLLRAARWAREQPSGAPEQDRLLCVLPPFPRRRLCCLCPRRRSEHP